MYEEQNVCLQKGEPVCCGFHPEEDGLSSCPYCPLVA